ncbi:hypothetical protein ACOMHN_023995 [Nucella lapillus]
MEDLCKSQVAPPAFRCVWGLAVAGMLCSMVFTLYSMLSAFDQYPVNTVTKVNFKDALPFPGVTLCNMNDVDTSLLGAAGRFQVPGNGSAFRVAKAALIFYTLLNESDPNTKRVLDTPINTLVNSSWILPGQCFNYCLINNQAVDCNDVFTPIQTSRTTCMTLNTEYPGLKAMTNAGPISGLRVYLNVHQEGYVYDQSVSAGLKVSAEGGLKVSAEGGVCRMDSGSVLRVVCVRWTQGIETSLVLGSIFFVISCVVCTQLFIHEPGQTADFHTPAIILSPGYSHYVNTKQIDYSFLPKPYMAYGDQACVDVKDPSFSQQLRLAGNYSFHMCTLQCAVDTVADLCQCRGVLNAENSSLPLCTMKQFYRCYDPFLCKSLPRRGHPASAVEVQSTAFNDKTAVYFNLSSANRSLCPRPCFYSEYDTQLSSAYFPSDVATATLQSLNLLPNLDVRKNYMELRVYLSKMVLQVVHEPVYTFTSVMGTIGGQMGFFLGASVLTVAEVVELLVCFLFRFLRRFSGPKERRVRTQVISVREKNQTAPAS